MRALLSLPTPPYAQLGDAPEPQPVRSEALVEVRAFSLNRGEVMRLRTMDAGSVTGWDVAGVVRTAAADGSGPPPGARVVGVMGAGAWAELAAVPTSTLVELPEAASFWQASTLPVAGLTALMTLEIGGFVLGRRMLVTGASGGVGRFAIQLAKLGGAHVTALARRTEGLAELGADEVMSVLEREGPGFDVILDAVGGPVLGAATERIAAGGTIVNFAATTDEPVSFPTRNFYRRAPGATLRGFYLFDELPRAGGATERLRRLAELVAAGRLDPQIDLAAPWTAAAGAIEALLDRRVAGKAVLTVE